MPWKRMQVREQRVEFVVRALRGSEPLSRLCVEFGIVIAISLSSLTMGLLSTAVIERSFRVSIFPLSAEGIKERPSRLGRPLVFAGLEGFVRTG